MNNGTGLYSRLLLASLSLFLPFERRSYGLIHCEMAASTVPRSTKYVHEALNTDSQVAVDRAAINGHAKILL